ncbi:hypothetical protein [Alloprevotella tannerae]
MKKAILFLALLAFAGCKERKAHSDEQPATSPKDSVAQVNAVPDSTIYGKADDDLYGMSTFAVITTQGDTLELDRTYELDGKDGIFYGDINGGDDYALTVRGKGTSYQAVGVAVNLSQLRRFVKDFTIFNARPIINGDTVRILSLDDKAFKAEGKQQYFIQKK